MRLFLLFSLMLLGMFSSAALIGQTATVHVQDDAATAIVGASVTLNTTIVLTDDSGDAIFAGLADGDYAYTVTADCYVAGAGVITIAGADNSDTVILSLSTSNDLFINLVPPGGFGFPPSGVTVRLYNDDLSYDETLVTGGFTVFSNVPYGTYNYTLSQDCKETVEGTTTVECTPGDIDALVAEFGVNQTTNDLFINLVPPGGFGFPPTGVTVRLYNDDLSYDETLVTGGFTVFSNVPYGTYNYTLSQDCKETVEGTTTVECTPGDIDALVAEFGVNQTTNDLFINLVPPGGFGFPPSGVTVRLYNDDLSYDETLVTGGFTVFSNVPYGTYNYTLSQDCKETVEGTTTVECTPGDIDALVAEFGVNQTTNDLFINLVPPGGFGFPPSGVTVRLYNDDLSYDETLVTGGFTVFSNVPYGTYNYTLSQDCKETVEGTTTVECTPGDIDALVAEFGVNQTTNDLFINLVPPGGFGFPPSGVTVRLYNDDLSYDETLVTGGFTVFSNVPYGTYNYTLSQDCKETVEGTTTVECTPGDIDALVAEFGVNQTTNDLFINLVPPGGFGFPPSGVTVRLYNDDLSYDETLVTGGFTVFSNVPYGTYNYTLSQDCKETVEGTTTVECTPGDIDALVAEFGVNQTTNDLFINLVPPGGFGFPPTGVTVRLYNDDLSYDETLVTGGFTVFSNVPYGTYNYTLSQDCKETVEGTTTVECTPGDIDALVAEFGVNQTTNDLFINLVPPGGFGFPPTGVTVRLYNDDLSYDETLVTGGFTVFSNVPYGTYNYTLSQDCKETVEGTTTVECTPGDIDALVAEFGVNQTTNDLFINLVPPGGFGFPPSGVTVRLYNDDLSYDETLVTGGFTVFSNVPYGTYNYTLSQDCKETVEGTTTVECTPGDIDALVAEFGVNQTTNDLFINLVPPGGFGFPPSGVTVRLYNDDLSYDETLVTGGFTVFSNVPYGTYNYTLSQDCKETVEGTTTVECAPGDIDALVAEFGVNQTTNDLFINLVPPGGFGFPPSGVTVRLYNDDLSYDETLVTGGFTVFSNVPYGTYNYTLSQDCKETVEGTTTVECTPGDIDALVAEFGVNQTTNDLFINLVPPGGFGFPPSGVTVRLYNDDLSYDETLVTGGFTVFSNVPYGTYNYTLSQDCKETVEGTTTVECTPGDIDALVAEFGVNQTTNDLFINLVPPGGFGFPPSGVTVRLYNDDLSYDETLVTGGFTVFSNVPYGTYNYTLSQDCKETVEGTTTVECTPGDIDALVAEFGVNQTTNDLFINLVPPGGFGFPPSGVTVRLYNDDLSYDETLVTGGFTVFSNVPYGTYNYTLSQDCKETVEGTTTVECTPGDIDALVAEFGVNQTTNGLVFQVLPIGGFDIAINNASIRVWNDDLTVDQTITSSDYNLFPDLPFGTYNYSVTKDCYETVTGTTTVDCAIDVDGNPEYNSQVVEMTLITTPMTINSLVFYVLPPGGFGIPINGATIRVWNDDLTVDQTITSSGYNLFADLPYGIYNYSVSKDCYAIVTGITIVECAEDVDGNPDFVSQVVELAPNTTNNVFFFVGNFFQEPDCTITVTNTETFEQTSITGLDILGSYVVENLPYGTYNYTVSKDCFVSQTGQVVVDCQPNDGEGNQLGNIVALGDMVPNTTNNVFFFVGNFFQEPDCTITVTNTETFEQTSITGLDILGSYVVENLPYGTYNYTVSKDCFVSQTGQVVVDCQPNDGEGNQLGNIVALGDMVPNTTNNVFFFVGNFFQEPDCTITVTNTETFEQTSITEQNILGDYIVENLPYGTYNYTVSKDCFVSQTGQVVVDCQPNDGEGNQLGNAVFLGDMVPNTTNNVFFFVGNFFQEPDCTITVTNTETFEQTSITGQNILGDYIVENLPYGTYNYTVSKDCFVSQTGQVVVDCQPNDGEGNQLGNAVFLGDMVPNTTNNVFFFVGNFFNEPDCTITVTNTETFEQTSITGLDILGSYVVENLPYGTYNYTVSKDCFVSQTGQVVVDCQPNDNQGNPQGNVVALGDMVPNTTNNVFFFVGNFFNEPDCTITVTNTETFEQTSITGLDILGSYVVENLPYGTYNYTVSKDCFVSQTGQVVVDCQPNDNQGNPQGNVVALGDMVPNTTNNVFFFVGNFFNEPDCTITVTNTETFEQTSITGLDILGSYVVENLPYGTYNYTVSKDCFVSQTGQVVVDCQPNDGEGNQLGNIVALGDMVPIAIDNSVTQVDGTLTANATGLTYQWTLCDGTEISGETNASFTPTVTGDYAVVVTDGNCSSTSECITVMVNGTTSLNAVDLSFYPNPVQDELTIDFEKTVSDVKVRVFNINGQLMFTQDFPETELIRLDMSTLIPGTYMLDLTVKGESLKTSIIKM